MPRIAYKCCNEECENEFYSFYNTTLSVESFKKCPKCNHVSKRQLSAAGVKSVFTVDNGFQARSVDIDLKVIEGNKEVSKKGYNRGD